MAETVKKQVKVLVIGTDHSTQRHQDTDPELEKVRAEFENVLRALIEKEEIDLVVEEAGDDKQSFENLKRNQEKAAEFEEQLRQMMEEDGLVSEGAGLFEGAEIVDHPVPTIAKKIADDFGVKHEDVDADIRVVDEKDLDSIKKRSDAMMQKILSIMDDAERVVVIVGERHREDVVQRLKEEGMYVEWMRFLK